MSTAGLFGYRLHNKIQAAYIGSSAYPSYAGKLFLGKLIGMPREVMYKFLVKEVKWGTKVSNNGVGYVGYKDAYDLLDLDWDNPCVTNMTEDCANSLTNGFFMEYAYILDFDDPGTKLMIFKGFGKKPTKGWEHLTEKPYEVGGKLQEQRWVNYNGSVDLTLPEHKAYILMHGIAYRHVRPGILSRCKRLVKAPVGDVLRECSMPEDYCVDPDNVYAVKEAADMLDNYLKVCLTKAA